MHKVVFSKLIIYSLLCFSFYFCDPETEIDISPIKKQLVVDGWIENDDYARVILTYNTGYFDNLDSASFVNLVARFANVQISDGDTFETMALTRDTNFFPQFIYRTYRMRGKAGKSYKLIIRNNGDTITSTTTIPNPVVLDNVYFVFANDSAGFIKASFWDDPSETNYYRSFTKVGKHNRRYFPTMPSVFKDDNESNGKYITWSVKKGAESFLEPFGDLYYKRGDTIYLKFATIDENSFQFWKKYDEEVHNSNNPFAANYSAIKSNIINGLGIWCGYGVSKYSIVAQ